MKFNYQLAQLESKSIKEGTIVPIYTSLLGDSETPISLYQKLKTNYKHSFLLESAESDEQVGRYSFLGFGARKTITFNKGISTCESLNKPGEVQTVKNNDPFFLLQKELEATNFIYDPTLPRLQGGYVGFVSYDCVHYFDNIKLPQKSAYSLPEMQFILPERLIVFDNFKRQIFLLTYLEYKKSTLAQDYQQACEQLINIAEALQTQTSAIVLPVNPTRATAELFEDNDDTLQTDYIKSVKTALKQIKDGEVFQIVLSTRRQQKTKADSLSIYRQLRNINPSPYMFLLDFEDLSVIGSSPETLVQIENKEVLVRPIAGTRPRGATPEEDDKLANDLLNDTKELAEHRMLLDLARNDAGRVSAPGSVKVENLLTIKKYSHVMHMVSDVRGFLAENKSPFEVFKACFPAGTLSGAPKIRAMHLISQLEPQRRGIYGGAVGYFDFSGNMDFAIAIRTIVKKGDTAYIQSGAGIVFDSKPQKEFEECTNKSLSSLSALL